MLGYSQEHITARVYTRPGSSICFFAKFLNTTYANSKFFCTFTHDTRELYSL